MTTSVVEVERKYDVGPAQAVPDLRAVPGVAAVVRETVELTATYYDTSDLRLRAAGTTLRRRTGGSDAGWHLKLPHDGDRLEVRADAGPADEGVPPELHALVRARTRSAPLAPVAELSTTRHVHRLLGDGGAVLAEVVDDSVTGRALGRGLVRWREWEVELVDAPREVLDLVEALLLRAGATPSASGSKVGRVLALAALPPALPPARPPWWARRSVRSRKVTAGRVVVAHLRDQVEELLVRDPQVRRDEVDAVHRMRVATRRLRSALTTFRPLLDRSRTDPLRAELRWLAAELGVVRDTEVLQVRLHRLLDEQDADGVVGPVRERVDAVLGERYRAGHAELLTVLDGERYVRLLDDLVGLVTDPPLLPAARERATDVLPRLVRRSWRRLDRALRAAEAQDGAEQDVLLHEARKDAKRARYAAEAVETAYGRPARAFAKALAQLQEVLGEHQDGVVLRTELLGLAQAAHEAGESSFTYGRLHAQEQARTEAAAATWPQRRADVSRRSLHRWLR